MNIPNDPIMLVSFLNLKLRDEFTSLSELVKAYDLDMEEITKKLAKAGFEYIPGINQIR